MPEDRDFKVSSGHGWPHVGAHQAPRPAAHHAQHAEHHQTARLNSVLQPTPVVKMWSTRGLEYAMMTVSLWISAVALAWLFIALINGNTAFDFLVGPTSALVVAVPVLAFFFIRLKKAEIKHPLLRTDPSRRRWTQATQFLAYIVVLINLISLAYAILSRYGTSHAPVRPLSKTILDAVVVLVIAGSLLMYYWLDEHRPIER